MFETPTTLAKYTLGATIKTQLTSISTAFSLFTLSVRLSSVCKWRYAAPRTKINKTTQAKYTCGFNLKEMKKKLLFLQLQFAASGWQRKGNTSKKRESEGQTDQMWVGRPVYLLARHAFKLIHLTSTFGASWRFIFACDWRTGGQIYRRGNKYCIAHRVDAWAPLGSVRPLFVVVVIVLSSSCD